MRLSGWITLLILAAGCGKPQQQDNFTFDSTAERVSSVNEIEEGIDPTHTTSKPKDFSAFEIQFQHIIKDEVKQTLAVSWIKPDSIEFRLLTEDQLCDTEYWGNAINKFPGSDGEIDEDDNNEAYASVEYVHERKEYSIRIRISVDNDKAKIIYTHKTEADTDCIPYPDLLLRRVKVTN